MPINFNGTQVLSLKANSANMVMAYANNTLVFNNMPDGVWIRPINNGYLTFQQVGDGYTTAETKSLAYSLNGGSTWTSTTLGAIKTTPIYIAANDVCIIKSTDTVPFCTTGTVTNNLCAHGYCFNVTTSNDPQLGGSAVQFNLGGHIKSLFNNDVSTTRLAGPLFYGSAVVDASNFIIDNYMWCHSMFRDCSFLTTGPQINATTLGLSQLVSNVPYGACDRMFDSCINLISINTPTLLPTTANDSVYRAMFISCQHLVTAPAINATGTFGTQSCANMFYGCSALTTIPGLYVTGTKTRSMAYMFAQCTSLKFATTTSTSYPSLFRIPMSGTFSGPSGSDDTYSMFWGTSGSYTSKPQKETNYYTNATVLGVSI